LKTVRVGVLPWVDEWDRPWHVRQASEALLGHLFALTPLKTEFGNHCSPTSEYRRLINAFPFAKCTRPRPLALEYSSPDTDVVPLMDESGWSSLLRPFLTSQVVHTPLAPAPPLREILKTGELTKD
jgi:hypothetical protein